MKIHDLPLSPNVIDARAWIPPELVAAKAWQAFLLGMCSASGIILAACLAIEFAWIMRKRRIIRQRFALEV